MYFKLNSYAYIVPSNSKGCIYDLKSGKVYTVSKELCDQIISLEQNTQIEETGVDRTELDKLVKLELGDYYEHNICVDKIRYGCSRNMKNMMFQKNRIYSLFLQIENICNMDCSFCDEVSYNRVTGCRKYSDKKLVSIDQYKKILFDAKKLGCISLSLLGGEPLLQKELVKEILKYAEYLEYKEIYLYTNAFLLDEKFIVENKNIYYVIQSVAIQQEMLNQIDNNRNNLNNFMHVLQILRDNDAKFILYLALTEKNYRLKEEMRNFYEPYKPTKILYKYIYQETKDKEFNKLLVCDPFNEDMRIDDKQFFHNLDKHPCLFGKFTVFLNGDIGVCPMMRENIISNIFEESLSQVLIEKKQEKYWYLAVDQIEKCGQCSMRYACFDCRAIEAFKTGNLYKKYYCNICSGNDNE
ncbi:MAG: radical SAM protein [Clostridia bacterium]